MKALSMAVTAIVVLGTGPTSPARAASQDECAIWLCLPGGFPAGCAAAYSAMISRLKEFKPPLPAFTGCTEDGSDSGMSFDWGKAAYIPERKVCVKSTSALAANRCLISKTVPESHVKGEACRKRTWHEEEHPDGCTRTDYYIDVYSKGKAITDTSYWNVR